VEGNNELLKVIPKVDVLLSDKRIFELKGIPRIIIVDSTRETLEIIRKGVLSHKIEAIDYEAIIDEILNRIDFNSRMHLRRVINGTGTVLHTNLGRAVLAKSAATAALNVSSCFSNLEFDIDKGTRGSRYSHVEDLICKITGAEAALVVNNNAAAIMLALSTLCNEKEAIVSRGQLVEIGGSFRVPEVMALSGATLVEVGTTNRTHLFDYEKAVNENTGVILKVHQSNYKILGFTEEVDLKVLVELGNKNNIPVLEDIGSGVFIDLSKYGFSYEPTVQNSISDGVDVVTFSGDKLLGGPQAGIIAGKREYISLMKKNQLARALRIDKMTLAALEATLRIYLDEEKAIAEIPSINMLTKNLGVIKKDAERLLKNINLKFKDKIEGTVVKDFSQVGGGAMPLERLETYTVALKPINITTEELEYGLRTNDIPIITRVYKDRVVIDVRTLFSEDYKIILDSLAKLLYF
jgi:L-seryl-tRNA(Ser) seleniumtransferase